MMKERRERKEIQEEKDSFTDNLYVVCVCTLSVYIIVYQIQRKAKPMNFGLSFFSWILV